MLTLRAGLTAIGTVLLLLSLTPSPAAADVQCSAMTGKCQVTATSPGSSDDSSDSERSDAGDGQVAAVSTCQRETAGVVSADCVSPEALPGAGAPQASPEEVAIQAIEELTLPLPDVGLAPPSGTGLVGAPVWMWVDDEDWAPVSTTASAGAVSVTATATPTSVTWRMGDGASFTCQGPGTPYTAGAGASASPDCGHTYALTGDYELRATVHWAVEWQGGGESGSDALTRTSSDSLSVGEAQSIIQ